MASYNQSGAMPFPCLDLHRAHSGLRSISRPALKTAEVPEGTNEPILERTVSGLSVTTCMGRGVQGGGRHG